MDSQDLSKFSRRSLKKLYPNVVHYKISDKYKDVIKKQLNQKIPESSKDGNDYTYKDIIKLLFKNSSKVYLVGGFIRDIIKNRSIKNNSDIDIKYTISADEIEEILKKDNINYERGKMYNIIFYVGNRKLDECLDMNYLNIEDKLLMTSNADCNSLLLDIRTYKIIDLYGDGVHDSKKNIWKKPRVLTHEEWVNSKTKLFWRMLKFSIKGFMIPDDDKIAIYKYVYNQPKKENIRWFDIWRVLDKKDTKKIQNIIKTDLERLDCKVTYKQFMKRLHKEKVFL